MSGVNGSSSESLKTEVRLFHSLQRLETGSGSRLSRREKLAVFEGLTERSTQPLQTQGELSPSGKEWRTEPEMPGHQFHPYGTQSLTNLCPCPLARASSIKQGPAPCCPRALPSGHVWMNPRLPPNEHPGRRMGSCLCQPPLCNFLTCFVARC